MAPWQTAEHDKTVAHGAAHAAELGFLVGLMREAFRLVITANEIVVLCTVLLNVNRQPTVSGLLFISAIFNISSRHCYAFFRLPGDYGLDGMRADLLRWVAAIHHAAAVLLLLNDQTCPAIFC